MKELDEFYNDFVLASHCTKDLELFKKKFNEHFAKSTTSEREGKDDFALKVAKDIDNYLQSCETCCFCKVLAKNNGLSSQNVCANCHAKESIECLKRIIFNNDVKEALSAPEEDKNEN